MDGKDKASLEVVESAQYAFASRPTKFRGPPTINDGEWAAEYFGLEPAPASRETGACPFRARFRKVSIPR